MENFQLSLFLKIIGIGSASGLVYQNDTLYVISDSSSYLYEYKIPEEKLNKIWKDWEAFAEYAFNKSHSTCYALIAYHTAYLKANYPAEYMASVMSNNINNTKQITLFMEDCQSMGVDVLGPDVNESQYAFSVNDKGQIRFGLGAIKGIGEGPSEAIVETRKEGRFKNIFEFFERVPSSQVNKRVVESLVIAGAYDEVDQYNRAQYFEPDTSGRTTVERLLKYGQSFQDSKNEMENSLFADFADEVKIEQPKINPAPEWQNMFKLNKEREIIGFYLSAHPLDEFKFQFQFIKGLLSRKAVLEEYKNEILPQEEIVLPVDNSDKDEDILTEIISDELDLDENSILEEETKKAEPKGSFNFLDLDEVEAFRDSSILQKQAELFNDPSLSWKEKQALKDRGAEYMVAGLVTEYTVRDGKMSGEKLAFVTLEDYSGSCSFRLGDRDYMRLRDKIDMQRFLIFKLKYAVLADGRVFVNVVDILELKDAFDQYAKSLTVVMGVHDLRKKDIAFFQQYATQNNSLQKLSFFIKNPEDDSQIEFVSLKCGFQINGEILELINQEQKYQFFLN